MLETNFFAAFVTNSILLLRGLATDYESSERQLLDTASGQFDIENEYIIKIKIIYIQCRPYTVSPIQAILYAI